MSKTVFSRNSYDRVAWFYEGAAHIYSGGKIRATKAWQIKRIQPEDSVLYVGAGSGEDVMMAAEMGASVTVVELSPRMLDKLDRKLRAAGLDGKVRLICCDASEFNQGCYDSVIANYFLNVFSHADMLNMFKHLASLVREDGKFMLADFAPVSGNLFQRGFQNLYYYAALSAFRMIAGNAFHPIYRYENELGELGWRCSEQACFRVLPGQSEWYRAMVFQRQ